MGKVGKKYIVALFMPMLLLFSSCTNKATKVCSGDAAEQLAINLTAKHIAREKLASFENNPIASLMLGVLSARGVKLLKRATEHVKDEMSFVQLIKSKDIGNSQYSCSAAVNVIDNKTRTGYIINYTVKELGKGYIEVSLNDVTKLNK